MARSAGACGATVIVVDGQPPVMKGPGPDEIVRVPLPRVTDTKVARAVRVTRPLAVSGTRRGTVRVCPAPSWRGSSPGHWGWSMAGSVYRGGDPPVRSTWKAGTHASLVGAP